MPKRVHQPRDERGRLAATYPYEEWFDGSIHRFDSRQFAIGLHCVRDSARRAAARRGHAFYARVDEGVLWIAGGRQCSADLIDALMLAERFWNRVDMRSADECWEWTWGKQNGYGSIFWPPDNRTVHASRIAWMLTHGPIPDGLGILHHCDNPPCCNPAHLYAGDQAANTRDMVVRGRHVAPRGEDQHNAKLSESEVREIRERYKVVRSTRKLAREYGVSRACIRFVLQGKSWRHVAADRQAHP